MAGEGGGINTAIASGDRNSAGVGFALPPNAAINVYNRIVQSGRVTRGSIGITFQPEQSPVLLRYFGVSHGVVITGIERAGRRKKPVLSRET